MVVGIVHLIGAVATVVMSALLWQQRARQGRAWPWLMAGLVAAALWPVTLCLAVAAYWRRKGDSKRAPLVAGGCALGAVVVLLVVGGLAEPAQRAQPSGPQLLRQPSSPPPSVITPEPVVAPPPLHEKALVHGILDDDRVRIQIPGADPQVVRIAGVQAPAEGECWSSESRAFAERALGGTTVQVTFGVGWSSGRSADPEVALTLPGGAGYSSLALQHGAARLYPQAFLGEGLASELGQAEATAKSAGLGLWGPQCGAGAPPETPKAEARPADYADCRQAEAAGAAPLRRGDTGYSSEMDSDGDGLACE